MKQRNNFRTVRILTANNQICLCERKNVKALKASVYKAFAEYNAMLWWKYLNGAEEE